VPYRLLDEASASWATHCQAFRLLLCSGLVRDPALSALFMRGYGIFPTRRAPQWRPLAPNRCIV